MKVSRAIAVLVGVIVLALRAECAVADVPNLLVNGDMEAGKIGEKPPAWIHRGFDSAEVYHYDFAFETCAQGRNGTKGARVQQREGLQSAYVEQDPMLTLTLDEDRQYVLSAWVRSDRAQPVRGDVVLMAILPGERVIQARSNIQVRPEWGEVSATLGLPALKGENGTPVKVSVRAIIQFYAPGTYFIDDVRLEGLEGENAAGPGEVLRTDPPGLPCPIGLKGGFVVMKDGALAAFSSVFEMKVSQDGGKSWGKPRALDVPDKVGQVQGVFRTSRGRIVIWTDSWKSPLYAWYSDDEGATWSKRINVGPHGMPLEGMRMIETKSGRLVLPVLDNWTFIGDQKESPQAYGTINGKKVAVEGHGHSAEIERTKVYFSDDQGATWKMSQGDIVIWKDDGYGGIWPADEPNIVELKDGRLMLYFRTTLGRVYASYSADGGEVWTYPEPTELANSISPVCLKRFPETGDLLLIWNNVSADEVRRGFRRGRLCSAVSRDDGKTWEHVKTIDTAGLPPVTQLIAPAAPGLVRAEKDIGELPPVLGLVHYADAFFAGDRVLVKYDKSFRLPEGLRLGTKLLDFPVRWFYED